MHREDPFDSPDPRLPPAELPGPVVQQREVAIEELLVVLMVFLCRIDLLQFRVLPSISNCFSTKVSMVQLPMLVLDSYESKRNFFYVYESRQQFNCTIQVPRMNQHCQDVVRFCAGSLLTCLPDNWRGFKPGHAEYQRGLWRLHFWDTWTWYLGSSSMASSLLERSESRLQENIWNRHWDRCHLITFSQKLLEPFVGAHESNVTKWKTWPMPAL